MLQNTTNIMTYQETIMLLFVMVSFSLSLSSLPLPFPSSWLAEIAKNLRASDQLGSLHSGQGLQSKCFSSLRQKSPSFFWPSLKKSHSIALATFCPLQEIPGKSNWIPPLDGDSMEVLSSSSWLDDHKLEEETVEWKYCWSNCGNTIC